MEEWFEQLRNWWYEKSGQKYKDEVRKQAKDASDFVVSYVKSPGFKQRLKLVPKFLKQYEQNPKYNSFPSDLTLNFKDYRYKVKLEPFTFYTKYPESVGSYFNPKSKTVYIQSDGKSNVTENHGNESAHEYGHVVEHMIQPSLLIKDTFYKQHPELEGTDPQYETPFVYSYIFPHFRESKAYKQMLFRLADDEDARKYYEKHPRTVYDIDSVSHDADPGESYADLMSLRYDLNATGIYDSRKANNPFTKEHLQKYKALKRKQRLFDNFTDDQIIKMMNEIAQNNVQTNNSLLYAKKGSKLIPKNKIIK